ncbi:hypothetical protein [Microbacterium binotii]|uniref:hypothetical protein n=1 Tax=Microbacterium binotii TaxID=462710 RepID=UPI001F1F399E|nr:hypothetical protein [Microbacterium binotii]UIN30927.1 hypothetical protein LXM64_01590 [Microbacterium binotii]
MHRFAWWHGEGWPTPDEWQALASVLTLIVAGIAAIIAVVQIRQGARQLALSAAANQRAAAAAESEARPYVSVYFDLRALPAANPTETAADGLVFVVVESVGKTPARDVALTVTPEFQSSGHGRPGGSGEDPALKALGRIFSGEPVIGMLAPGQKLEYILDFTSEVVGKPDLLPQRYDVVTSYTDPVETRRYSEAHILDLAPWSYSIAEPTALDTIARQIRRINENLEKR